MVLSLRSLNTTARLVLFSAVSALALFFATTFLPLLGPEPVQQQQAGQAGQGSSPTDGSGASRLPSNANESAAIEEKGKAQAKGDPNAVSGGYLKRLGQVLAGPTGTFATMALLFLAFSTIASLLSEQSTRRASRARLLPHLAPESNVGFVVRNLGPTPAFLRGYRCLPVNEGFDPTQFGRCGAARLTRLHQTLEVGDSIDLPATAETLDSERPWLLIEVAFEDVFRISHRSWRLFSKGEGDGYKEGEDGELPSWWSA